VSQDTARLIADFAGARGIPEGFVDTAVAWYVDGAARIAARFQQLERPLLVGVSGCQGSGKSTLADLLATLLSSEQGLRVAQLSLDDFYLGRESRAALGRDVHALFATRGVPGTHDLGWLEQAIDELLAGSGTVITPMFDKAEDDRTGEDRWHHFGAPVDIVLLEGWCIGIPPQSEGELITPCNDLEQRLDPDGSWRTQVNQLLREYQSVFDRLDLLFVLQAPDFDAVARWRFEQEEHLAARRAAAGQSSGHAIMDRQQVAQFVQYFQRLTEHGLKVLPALADRVWLLNADRSIDGIWRGGQ